MLTQTAHGWNLDFPSVCSQHLLLPFSGPPLSRKPGPEERSVPRPNHTPCVNFFSTNSGRFPNTRGLPMLNLPGLTLQRPDSSCRRKCPSIGNSPEIHSLASGVILANCLGREKLTQVSEIKSREG